MKTTVVIQDGRMQLVLTPESEAEKRMIAPFSDGVETRGQRLDTRVDRGNFSECVGGWVRDMKDVQSLMVGVRVVQEKEREGDAARAASLRRSSREVRAVPRSLRRRAARTAIHGARGIDAREVASLAMRLHRREVPMTWLWITLAVVVVGIAIVYYAIARAFMRGLGW